MLRYLTAGESHGESLVAFLSGLPAGLDVDQAFVDRELWRRQQGFGRGGRMKIETRQAHIVSGVRHGKTIGSPIAICWRTRTGRTGRKRCRLETGDPDEAEARGLTASRTCGSGRRAEIQLPRSPICAGTRVGPGIDGARGVGAMAKLLSARTGD